MTPVFPQPFDTKDPAMLQDRVKGFRALHPDALEALEHLCAFSWERYRIRPLITEFGRTRSDQEAIYGPVYLQSLEHQGISDDIARQQALELARNRFTWHAIDTATGHFRAFDLRDWIYTAVQRQEIMAYLRGLYPKAELLDHAVQGGARHFHVGIPDPLGRPHSWV